MNLNDNYVTNGTSFPEFKELVAEISNSTYLKEVITNSNETVENDGLYHLEAYDEDKNILYAVNAATGKPANFMNFAKTEGAVSVIQECIKQTGMLFRFFENSYLVSKNAYASLGDRYGMNRCIDNNFYEKDAFLSQLMIRHPQKWNLIVRKDVGGSNALNKIFGVFTPSYEYIPQQLLIEVAETLMADKSGMGTGNFVSYYIDQNQTEFIVEFPEKGKEIQEAYGMDDEAKMIPCIRLVTSDTGVSSFVIQAVWKKIIKDGKKSFLIQDEIPIRHIGKYANRDYILKTVKERIFPLYTKLPEKLLDSLSIFISPEKTDEIENYEEANRECLNVYLKNLVKKAGIVVDVFGKGFSKQVVEIVMSELNFRQEITAYDVVSTFLSLPGRIEGIPKSREERFEKACCKVAFLNLEPPKEVKLTALPG